jgi:hypothetical protein
MRVTEHTLSVPPFLSVVLPGAAHVVRNARKLLSLFSLFFLTDNREFCNAYEYFQCVKKTCFAVCIHFQGTLFLGIYLLSPWARGSLVPLGYKPERRGFESRCGEILNLPNPSGRNRHWGLLTLEQK